MVKQNEKKQMDQFLGLFHQNLNGCGTLLGTEIFNVLVKGRLVCWMR